MTQRVSTLSGGEQTDCYWQSCLPRAILVLDEPTNDSIWKTLELLQEVIADWQMAPFLLWSAMIADFLDRTVTAILAFDGDGKIVAHAGGYSEYLARGAKPLTAAKTIRTARQNLPRKTKAGTSDTRAGRQHVSALRTSTLWTHFQTIRRPRTTD